MKRPIVILGGVMVLGIAAYLLLSIDPHRVQEKQKFLANDTSKVDFIHIQNKDGEITMKRVGGNWKITDPYDYPANASYVKTLLEKVAGLEMESLITKDKDTYSKFELGDSASYIEVGKDGGKIDKFYCGKPNETYTHTYMRKKDSDEVWLVAGTPKSSFTRRPDDWRDKSILNLDRSMIEKMILKFPDENVELVRNLSPMTGDSTKAKGDTSWTVHPQKGEPFQPQDKELNRIMNTLCKMNSMDFVLAGRDTMPDFSKPEFGIEVFMEGNQHEYLDFLSHAKGDATRWYVRKDGDEKTIFIVYQSSAKNLMKRPDVLKNGEPEVNAQEEEHANKSMPKGMRMPPGGKMPPGMNMPPGMKMPPGAKTPPPKKNG